MTFTPGNGTGTVVVVVVVVAGAVGGADTGNVVGGDDSEEPAGVTFAELPAPPEQPTKVIQTASGPHEEKNLISNLPWLRRASIFVFPFKVFKLL